MGTVCGKAVSEGADALTHRIWGVGTMRAGAEGCVVRLKHEIRARIASLLVRCRLQLACMHVSHVYMRLGVRARTP